MTIRIPGFMDEIQNYLPGINEIVSSIANPDYRRQQALRKQMLENPELQQQLTDMGAKRVEEVYGKGTGGFAGDGPKSVKKQVSDATAAALPDILANPRAKEELIANQTGTQTTTARNTADLTLKNAQQNNELGGIQLSNAQREKQRQEEGLATGRLVHARLGQDPVGIDLYTASKKGIIKGDELNKLLAVKEYSDKYNRDREDYWKAQDNALEQQRINVSRENKGFNLNEYYQRVRANKAGMIAETYSADPQAVASVMQSTALRDKYLAMKEPPTDPADKLLYEAANALKAHTDKLEGDTFIKKQQQFRLSTQKLDDKFSSRSKATPEEKQAALREKNIIAKQMFGSKAPQWKYDTNDPQNSSGFMSHTYFKDPAMYRVGGDPSVWGMDEQFKPADDVTTAAANPMVESAAQDVIAGKASLGELLAKAPSEEVRTQLSKRVKELTKGSDSTPTSTPTDTIGSEKVKSALKIPETAALNLNVGESVKPSATEPKTISATQAVFQGLLTKNQMNYVADYLKNALVENGPTVKNRSGRLVLGDGTTKIELDTLTPPEIRAILERLKRSSTANSTVEAR